MDASSLGEKCLEAFLGREGYSGRKTASCVTERVVVASGRTRVCHLALDDGKVDAFRVVHEESKERIGSALKRMAEDLVKERRQVMVLRRENQQLRAELDSLKRQGRVSSTTDDARVAQKAGARR